MKRTQSQNKRLYGLFGRLGIDEDTRKMMVANFTNGRTEHTSDMSVDEANALISALNDELRNQKKQQYEESNRLRRKIFKLFYELGWIAAEMKNKEKRLVIANWIIQRTKTGKNDINQLTVDELNSVIRQLKAIKRNYEEHNYEERKYEERKKKIETLNRIKTVTKGIYQYTNYGKLCLN